MMNSFSQYMNYLESVATGLKLIGHSSDSPHFARSLEEATHLKKTLQINEVCMIGEYYEGKLNINSGVSNVLTGGFYILKAVDSNDFGMLYAVMDECESVAKKVVSKMLYDKGIACENFDTDNAMIGFVPSSIEYNPVPKEELSGLDNVDGVFVSFVVETPEDFIFDPESDWIDEGAE